MSDTPRTEAGKRLWSEISESFYAPDVRRAILAIEAEASTCSPEHTEAMRHVLIGHAVAPTPNCDMKRPGGWGNCTLIAGHSGRHANSRGEWDSATSPSTDTSTALREAAQEVLDAMGERPPEGPEPTTIEVERWYIANDGRIIRALSALRATLSVTPGDES